jgi:4a-hydroxytetrahydrobiopterin dehydratase
MPDPFGFDRQARGYHRSMPYAPLLDESELASALATLPDWSREGEAIVRSVRCASFREAIALVNAVADAAEAADHHPDITIVWRRVGFRLTSKASGGITRKDVDLAGVIDRLAEASAGGAGFREAFPIIRAADPEALARFYVDAFGFEETFRFPADGELAYAFLKLKPLGIGIGRLPADAALPPGERAWELWIYADDADAAVERARVTGASVLEEPQDQPWGERVALVADPEGNQVRIGAVRPKARG